MELALMGKPVMSWALYRLLNIFAADRAARAKTRKEAERAISPDELDRFAERERKLKKALGI